MFGVASLTEQAVHYEVPKTVEYWLPALLALGAAAAISSVWRLRRLGVVRPAAVFLLLAVSVYPLTEPVALGPITLRTSVLEAPQATNLQIGEHRGAESLGLALREAETGYWTFLGYPDPRRIIDAPRQEVVDEIRSLETSGRLGPASVVLHIAGDFQQWSSVPIGVFTGAMETSISLNPLLNIHTEGGRLLGFDQLPSQLAGQTGVRGRGTRGLEPVDGGRGREPDRRGRLPRDLVQPASHDLRAQLVLDPAAGVLATPPEAHAGRHDPDGVPGPRRQVRSGQRDRDRR